MITNQAYLFLIFTLNGLIIALLFDFFRILRRSFKTKDFVTYLEDILFWIITGIIILYSIFIFNNGEIRFFMFVGIILGVTLYMLLLSSYIIKISIYFIDILKKILRTILKIISYPFTLITKIIKKIFFRPVSFIIINIKNIFYKTTKNSKKLFNNIKNSKKNKKKEGFLK